MEAIIQIHDGWLAQHWLTPEQIVDAIESALTNMVHPESAKATPVEARITLVDECLEPVGYSG